MKKINSSKWLAGLLAAWVVVFVSGIGLCDEVKAKLTKLEGAVKVRVSDTADWKAAAEGEKLGAGAAVRCEANSSAFLNWAGNTLKVHPLSDVKVGSLVADPGTGLQQSEIDLLKGKTFARARKLSTKDSSFVIKTPSAIAGVRGTDFGVSYSVENQSTFVAVLSDEVIVEGGGVEMVISESMHTLVEMGAPPMEPMPIPADMMLELKADIEEVGEVEAAVEEVGEEEVEEEAAEEEEAPAEEEAEEEAAAEEEAPAEEEAAAEIGDIAEETVTETMEKEAAAEEEEEEDVIGDVIEDTTTETLEGEFNQNIAEESETLFQECCQPR